MAFECPAGCDWSHKSAGGRDLLTEGIPSVVGDTSYFFYGHVISALESGASRVAEVGNGVKGR